MRRIRLPTISLLSSQVLPATVINILFQYCPIDYSLHRRKEKGEAGDPDWVKKNPDWNKVVLIPVKVDFDTNNSIIGVSNNLDMESAELKGGTKAGNELKMQIIYTKF